MSTRCAVALAMFAVAGDAAGIGADGQLVGWRDDPYFVDATPDAPANTFPRELYPPDQSAAAWTERVRIDELPRSAGQGAQALLDGLLAQQRPGCPELSEHRLPADGDADRGGVLLWHCPRNAAGRGEVGAHRVLLVDDRAFVMSVQGDYPPYAPGTTPLDRAHIERWSGLQNTFHACATWTNPGCWPDAQQLAAANEVAPDADEAEELRRAEARGQAMYDQDRIAWHGTDFAIAQKAVVPKGSKKGAFLAIEDDEGGRVYFVKTLGRDPRVLGAVAVDAQGGWSVLPKTRSLPDDMRPRFAALARARDVEFRLCTERLNTIVIPAENRGDWLVYLMSATQQAGAMLLGGHTRVLVSADGARVLATEPLANSCIGFDLAAMDAEATANGLAGAVVFTTHVVSDVPAETHVFQSLVFDRPILVVTRDAAWRVADGFIAKLAIAPASSSPPAP